MISVNEAHDNLSKAVLEYVSARAYEDDMPENLMTTEWVLLTSVSDIEDDSTSYTLNASSHRMLQHHMLGLLQQTATAIANGEEF